MPGRSFNSSATRYGFNGMEKDDEVKGVGNSYDFGARMYDPRLNRCMSVDPLSDKYPDLSPYNFAGNSPIYLLDPDGKRILIYYQDSEGVSKYYEYGSKQEMSNNSQFVLQSVAALDKLNNGSTQGGGFS